MRASLVTALTLLAAASGCNGTVSGGDPDTEQPIGIIHRGPPVTSPTTSCAAGERTFAGSGGATVCAGYDGNGALSYAYSQDHYGTYHGLAVEYPAPPLGNCVSADIRFSDGPNAILATPYFVHDMLVCWDGNTLQPITELLQYYQPSVGTWSYKVDNFDYSAGVAGASSNYLDAASNVTTPLGSAQVDLLAPAYSAGASVADVPARFGSQLDRAAFFTPVFAGSHSFQSLQIDRFSDSACLQMSQQPNGANPRMTMECVIGLALADASVTTFASRFNWSDTVGVGAGKPTCKNWVLAPDPTQPPKCGAGANH
jgi:hypothetical protein